MYFGECQIFFRPVTQVSGFTFLGFCSFRLEMNTMVVSTTSRGIFGRLWASRGGKLKAE